MVEDGGYIENAWYRVVVKFERMAIDVWVELD